MDKVFQPDRRKWISPVTHLGNSIEELKQLVRQKKEEILVVDPIYTTPGAPTYRALKEVPDVSNERDFMRTEARNVGENDLNAEGDSEGVGQDEEGKVKEWVKSDDACNGAVKLFGGAKLFTVKKKQKKKGKGKGRKSKSEREKKEQTDDEDSEEESEMDIDIYEETLANMKTENELHQQHQQRKRRRENDQSMDNASTFTEGQKVEPPASSMNAGTNHASSILDFPDIGSLIIEPDDVLEDILRVDDLDLDFHEDDIHNYATTSSKYDAYRKLRPDLLNSDSEESNKENESSSDDEEEKLEDTGTGGTRASQNGNRMDSNQPIPGCSKNMMHEEPEIHLRDIKVEEGTEEEKLSDFKNFSNWVFNRTKGQKAASNRNMRPGLMNKFGGLAEADIIYYQKITNANLAAVTGEVYQDQSIMESASMPLLAPEVMSNSRANLQSLAVFISHGDEPSCFPWKSLNVQQQMNDDFAHEEFLTRMEQQKKDVKNPRKKNELVDKEQDFLVQVLIYQATDPEDAKLPEEAKISTEPKLAYELSVLGSQTVKDLMMAIHCDNDYLYLEDVPHPDKFVLDEAQYAKAKFPSSVMLIHNTVYDNPGAGDKDYASILTEWSNKHPHKGVGPFKKGDWNVQLKDLELRFGFPYVFIHLGGCEHIFVFTKARLLHLEDYHLKKDYPKIHGISRFKNVYCRVDNEYLARWAVLDFKEFPENPMLLCSECVSLYCYDSHKKKRGSFKLYPFTQVANMI